MATARSYRLTLRRSRTPSATAVWWPATKTPTMGPMADTIAPPPPHSGPTRRITPRRIGLLAAVAGAFAVLVFFSLRQSTGTGTDDLAVTSSDAIERLIPPRGDEILQQATVGIDLAPGYEGLLAVNGTAIPEDQLSIEPALNTIQFTPGEGKAVEAFGAGQNCAEAIYWESAEGRDAAETVSWCFEVT
ncbi:hypothetical protein BH24ACT3_BH24ACT3_12860 [soil metagenome]